MNKIIKGSLILVIIFFFSLFFSRYSSYNENKKVLTDSAIERFEKDLKEGKEIVASNYIEPEKNYNNGIANMGKKTSRLIENTFSKGIKYLMKFLEKIE